MRKTLDIKPKNDEEAVIFAEESLVEEVQRTIQGLLNKEGIDYKEFGNRLGISEQDVEKLFENEYDMTIRELGRIMHALTCKSITLDLY